MKIYQEEMSKGFRKSLVKKRVEFKNKKDIAELESMLEACDYDGLSTLANTNCKFKARVVRAFKKSCLKSESENTMNK